MKRIIAFVLVLVLLCTPVLAHSGGTDSNGGHYDRDAGEYHYHHGYPAHQHPNGICPYEDRAATAYASRETTTTKSQVISEPKAGDNVLIIILTSFIWLPLLIQIIIGISDAISLHNHNRNKHRSKSNKTKPQEQVVVERPPNIGMVEHYVRYPCVTDKLNCKDDNYSSYIDDFILAYKKYIDSSMWILSLIHEYDLYNGCGFKSIIDASALWIPWHLFKRMKHEPDYSEKVMYWWREYFYASVYHGTPDDMNGYINFFFNAVNGKEKFSVKLFIKKRYITENMISKMRSAKFPRLDYMLLVYKILDVSEMLGLCADDVRDAIWDLRMPYEQYCNDIKNAIINMDTK